MLDAVALEARKIETLENAQGKQELECLRGRRQRIDAEVAVADRQGILPDGLYGLDILKR